MGHGLAKSIKPVPESFCLFTMRLHLSQGAVSLLHAKTEVRTVVRDTLKAHWTGGVEKELNPHPVLAVFKLAAFDAAKFWDGTTASVLFCEMLNSLSKTGWHLHAAPDMFLTLDDAELIFLREKKVPDCRVFALRIDDHQMFKLTCADAPVRRAVQQAITNVTNLQSETAVDANQHVYKMEGSPWAPENNEERTVGVQVLSDVFKNVGKLGYGLVSPACMDGDQDTLYFEKSRHARTGDYATIVLTGTDGMVLFNFPKVARDEIKKLAEVDWPGGMGQFKLLNKDVFLCQLKGSPWNINKSQDLNMIVAVKNVILTLFERLSMAGWQLLCTADISQSINDKSIFMFTSGELKVRRCIGLQPLGSNKLWLLKMWEEEIDIVERVLRGTLGSEGIQDKDALAGGAIEFQLCGSPWRPTENADTLVARHVISVVVATLCARGWRVACCADIQEDIQTIETESVNVVKKEKKTNKAAKLMGIDRKATVKQQRMVTKTSTACDSHLIVFVRED